MAPPPARIDGADWEQQQTDAVTEAETYLEGVADRVRTRVAVKTSVPYGRAVDQIVEAVERLGADGVVMATHGRTGLAHLPDFTAGDLAIHFQNQEVSVAGNR